ncbi:MAG TPA: methyl-accepting chemotaxis protein, partial [Thermoanaerobaculia bacterium]|nr:methyl-accepting chemotaxis protein [Thermoanaerobaculia bacterium]
MNFTARYLSRLLVPPAVATLPFAFLFIASILPLTAARGAGLAALLLVFDGLCGAAVAAFLRPAVDAIDRTADLSAAASATLRRTIGTSVIVWPLGALAFAIAGRLFFGPFLPFLVAALLIAFAAIAWSYAEAKHQLAALAGETTALQYSGRQLPLGTKIGIAYVAPFLLFFAVFEIAPDWNVLLALYALALVGAAAWALTRDLTTPLRTIRMQARQMAEGKFDAPAQAFADDQFGELAESFAETRANLRRLLGRIGGSGSTITNGVRVITGGTARLLIRARDQASVTESSSMVVENVRVGISAVVRAADGVNELTHDASSRALQLQASAEEVARSTDHLFQSVEKTSASTTEMNASMNEMSQRTDVLSGISDEVLSFVAQMDSTIEELRAGAQATAGISRQVREDAEAGGGAVNRTMAGINVSRELSIETAQVLDTLQQSVGQISQIVNVIEEITNRTNLLALNAAIIAAQAGEHGAGFTVVADEIRELAERTRGSTKEIGTIIKAVQGGSREAVAKMHEGVARVEENVGLAEEAAASLGKIVDSASRSYEMATRISGSLDEQALASRHLHDVTSRMSDHISEITRATREQARGTQLMAQESERVREIAAQVRNAADEQSMAGRGITTALERIAEDATAMRDLLEQQLAETDQIAEASRTMLDIAQSNDEIA